MAGKSDEAIFDAPVEAHGPGQPPPGGLAVRVCAVGLSAGALLLVRRRGPRGTPAEWDLPGGVVQWGEQPEAAARRVLHEQAGADAIDLRVLRVHSTVDREQRWSLALVVGATVGGEPKPGDGIAEAALHAVSDTDAQQLLRSHGLTLSLEGFGPGAGTPPAAARDAAVAAAVAPTVLRKGSELRPVYEIEEVRDRNALSAWLLKDPVRNGYVLGDLEEPYFAQSRFFVARKKDQWKAVVARYDFADIPTVITVGDAAGIVAILRKAYQPPMARFHLLEEHVDAIRPLYLFGNLDTMDRMGVRKEGFYPIPPSVEPVAIGAEDAEEVYRLYLLWQRRYFGLDAIRKSLKLGPYYGIRTDGKLVAVAGTHTLSKEYRVATIGGFYTHPEYRRKRYAATLCSHLVKVLFQSVEIVGLNVEASNSPAIRTYESLGFRLSNRFFEGTGTRAG